MVCERTLTSWRKSSSCVADARMVAMLGTVSQRVEEEAGEDLGEEVRRLGRHHLARGRDRPDEVDGRGAHEESRLDVARAHAVARLGGGARVVEPAEVRDVVL